MIVECSFILQKLRTRSIRNNEAEAEALSQRENYVSELFDQYHAMLRILCSHYVQNERLFADIIDDSILDTFVQAYLSYESLRSHPNVKGWLITTCFHRLKPRINQVRRRERHRAFSMDDHQAPQISSGEAWEERNILQLDAREQIDELCAALTERERHVFQEYYVQGFTLQEVAYHQHISLSSVKASLRQIKRKAINQKNSRKFSD